MNKVEELKNLLVPQGRERSSGPVLKTEGESVFVLEKGQTRVAKRLPGDVSEYRPGDVVSIEAGIVMGRTSRKRSKNIYL